MAKRDSLRNRVLDLCGSLEVPKEETNRALNGRAHNGRAHNGTGRPETRPDQES